MNHLNWLTSRPALLSGTLLVTLFAACSDEVTERESSEAPQVSLIEVLRLGDEAAGDTVLFASINQIAVNSRGEIVVVETSPRQMRSSVRVFRDDGMYLTDIGASGEGPGEYRILGSVVTGPADSVYLWNPLTDRVLIYSPNDYAFVRHATVADEGAKQATSLTGILNDGWIMTIGLGPFLEADDGSMSVNDDNIYELRRVSLDGSYAPEVIAELRLDEWIYSTEEDGSFHWVPLPFGRFGRWLFGPDELIYYGWSDSIRIEVMSVTGIVQNIITHNHQSVPIADAELEAEQPEPGSIYEEMLARRKPHTTKPAYETFLVDDIGNVWIKLSNAEGAQDADWLILDHESNAVGMAALPVAVDLNVVRDNHAYGVVQEEGGSPMVVVYEIQ